MARIFSKIRHSLPKEGKLTRYLSCAPGEIIPVVAGMQIALYYEKLECPQHKLLIEQQKILQVVHRCKL